MNFEQNKIASLYEYQKISNELTLRRIEEIFNDAFEKKSAPFVLQTSKVDLSENPLQNVLRNQLEIKWNADEIRAIYSRACHHDRSFVWWPVTETNKYFFGCRYEKGVTYLFGWPTQVFVDILKTQDLSHFYVITRDGWVAISDVETAMGRKISQVLGLESIDFLFSTQYPSGRTQFADAEGDVQLASYQRLSVYPMAILSVSPRHLARQALLPFVLQGVLALFSVLVLTVFSGVFLSKRLTKGLDIIAAAFERVGRGELSLEIPVVSQDEIGKLTKSLNQMQIELKKSIQTKERNAVIESELKVAAELQMQFFPPMNFKEADIQLTGFYEPYAECGGDWWTYQKKGHQTLFLIADVTGHGLSSAFVTACLRSALVISDDIFDSPKHLMERLNQAICRSTGDRLHVSCLVVVFDSQKKSLSYCNASHEASFYWNLADAQGPMTIKPKLMMDLHGPVLGRDLNTIYKDSLIAVHEATRFLFYTDGLVDLPRGQDQRLGDAGLMRMLMKTSQVSHETSVRSFKNELANIRQNQTLADDLSYVILDFDPQV